MDPITIRTPFVVEFEYWTLRPGLRLNLSLHLFNEQGVLIFNTTSVHEPVWHGKPFPEGLFRSVCSVPGDLLNDGLHRLEILVVRDEGTVLYRSEDILIFDVQNVVEQTTGWHGRWPGAVHPRLPWRTELVEQLSMSPPLPM
ncbi:MAG: hypothetical protein H0U67_13760 [Gemmatimonadetes bacterium]|nr:hypothetical protein [Gemmatimonadota bacterium]